MIGYTEFRSVLDAEMKRLKSAGMDSRVCKAEPITPQEEDLLWEEGILHQKHWCQIQVVEKIGERAY